MLGPRHIDTKTLERLFDSGKINVEQLNELVRRLRSVIDEANADEVVATVAEWVGARSGPDRVSLTVDVPVGHTFMKGEKLYARPIPAQQSPAVAVPDEMKEAIQLAISLLNDDCSFGKADLLQGLLDRGYFQSPRITEQELREIVSNHFKHIDNPAYTLDWYIETHGHSLLAKLIGANNEKAN